MRPLSTKLCVSLSTRPPVVGVLVLEYSTYCTVQHHRRTLVEHVLPPRSWRLIRGHCRAFALSPRRGRRCRGGSMRCALGEKHGKEVAAPT